MLALQLLLACSLESREVVLELLSYFLYSPDSCRPELRKLLDGLGLQDPQGFLFKEMMTWVRAPDVDSKAALRKHCCHKLEEMIRRLQVLTGRVGLLAPPPAPRPPSPPASTCFPQVFEGEGQGTQVRLASSLPCSVSVPHGSSPVPNPPFLGLFLFPPPRKESAARSPA